MRDKIRKLIERFRKAASATDEGLKTPPELRTYARNIKEKSILTDFEAALLNKFDEFRHHANYRVLCVSIIPMWPDGPYAYTDPINGTMQKASFGIAAINMPTYDHIITMERKNGRTPVMMLYLHGAPLEEQIPNWNKEHIVFPDKYLTDPIITIPNAIGILAKDPYNGGIGIASMMHKNNYATRRVLQQAPLFLPAAFKPAIGKKETGERYPLPQKIIRGVLNNDM